MNGAGKKIGKWSWVAYLSLGGLMTVVYFSSPPTQDILYPLVGFFSAVAVGVGILVNRPCRSLPWCLMALGPFFGSIADLTWFFYTPIFGIAVPFPSVADAFYLINYFFLITGMLLLQRGATGGGRAALIDPLIIATGAGLLSWMFLMEPYARDKSLSLLAQTVSIAYPLVDLLLLTVLARLILSSGKRVPSLFLLGVSMLLLLVADSIYGYQVLAGTYRSGGWLDAGWLGFYVLFGTAALHPSMRTLTEPALANSQVKLSRKRLVLLGAASLTAPAILIAQAHPGDKIDTFVIAGGSAVMFLLTLFRMEGLVNALVRTLSERERLQGQLEHQALHDPLTGLANRALFSDRLEHALSRTERLSQRLAVLFLDLDDFKSINDNLGHDAGDELLTSVSGRIKSCIRSADTTARLGGDEFAVLLEEILDVSAASRAAERILEALSESHLLAGEAVSVGASIGIAIGSFGESLTDLLRNADVALYAAKASGKNRYEVFKPGMRSAKARKLELESDLQRALENQEFDVHYQPIISLKTGEVTEIEALVRWQHPEHGLIFPAEFIPIAEENGLIIPIGRWVLRVACRQIKAWQDEYPSASRLTLAVNLSPKQFSHPDLIADITQTLEETGLDPRCLKLEITEHLAVEDIDSAIGKLEQLKELGVHIALDDFGSGYSALNYLKAFPVDTLKVDRSFVDGMGSDLRATSIVGAVIALAKSLNLSVTAEGTETVEQLSQLRSLGCDQGQGFYFSKPVPGEAISNLFETIEEHPDISAPV